MTINQKRTLLKKIQQLQTDIEQLEQVRISLAKNEYASATISSGSGSKSYTRADIGKISTTIKELKAELRSTKKILSGESQGLGKTIYVTYI